VQSLKIALTILVALLLQMVLPTQLAFFQRIDLPLLVTIYFSLQRAPIMGMVVGVAAGIGGDLIAGGIIGIRGFTKTLLSYFIAMLSIRFSLENPLVRLAVVAVASAANEVLYVGLNMMLEQSLPYIGNWSEFGKAIGKTVLLNLIASIPIFLVLDRVFPEREAAGRMAIRKRFYE
jgi:rod shape-determining protein MreD